MRLQQTRVIPLLLVADRMPELAAVVIVVITAIVALEAARHYSVGQHACQQSQRQQEARASHVVEQLSDYKWIVLATAEAAVSICAACNTLLES